MLKKIGIVSFVVMFILVGCEKQTEAPPPPGVMVAPVLNGDITDSLTVIGQVQAMDAVNLVARVKGFLLKQNFKDGEFVKKGTVLYEIEPYQYEAELKNAEAQYQKALADQKNADADYKRQETLFKGDAVSERARDNALAKKMEAEAAVKAGTAAIETAKLNLSYTKIVAPFSGWVGLRRISVGNVVGPESGTLVTLVNSDPIKVEFAISESALLQMVHQKHSGPTPPDVVVHLLFQNGSEYNLTGKIAFWDNQVNPTTGTIKLQAEFANPLRILIPGMYVRVRIQPKVPSKVLMIPVQAVLDNQNDKYVLVVNKDNVVVRREVTLGADNGVFVAVQNGLEAGEQVIVEGLQKARPQSKVAPKLDSRYASEAAAAELVKAKAPKIIATPDKPKAAVKPAARQGAK